MARQLSSFTCLLVLLFASRCAQIVELSGGERDKDPPKLIEAVPANGSTSLSAGVITLRFDEFVQLKDLNNQLMISPRLKTPAEVSAEGKSVVVRFKKEDLLPNTTYRIDFGTTIADMHESNSMPGYSYVFSTGAFIDSLKVSGAVSTASNNLSFAGAMVALYKVTGGQGTADSLPMKQPPDYSARSAEGGGYRVHNLPAGSYRLYAFHDNNRNNLYDAEAERVAFHSDMLYLSKDTGISLRLFTEEPRKLFVKRAFSPFYGMAQVILNKKVYSTVSLLHKGDRGSFYETSEGKEKDTITVLYHSVSDTLSLVLDHPEHHLTDTVHILLPEKKVNNKRFRIPATNAGGGVLAKGLDLEIIFPVWMDTNHLKQEKLRITSAEDSLTGSRPLLMKWKDIRTLVVQAPWKEGAAYRLRPDTGMARDLDGVSCDTATLSFRRQGASDVSRLLLKVVLPKKQAYVVQLMNQQDQVVQQRRFAVALSSSNAVTLEFNDVLPGNYRAKIVFDDNANGRWDTGNLLRRMQPEKVIIHTKELKLLADWEVEEEMQVKE